MYKIFISHASEDKALVAKPLAELLILKGLDVWYDEFSLKIGDSLRASIDKGLREADFGIVILSPDFIKKNWPKYELDSLVTLELAFSKKIILPIWHNISAREVIDFSPSLGDKVAANTHQGLENILENLLKALNYEESGLMHFYDINKDESISLNWMLYNSERKFYNNWFSKEENCWNLTAEDTESVGINLFNLPIKGKINFEYLIQDLNAYHLNIMFFIIPIRKHQQTIEVGFEIHNHPENAKSFFRVRSRPKIILGTFIKESIEYDFKDLEDIDYAIFAPRINEGCPFPGKGKFILKNISVENKT